jgi:FkbM family methyltransferase
MIDWDAQSTVERIKDGYARLHAVCTRIPTLIKDPYFVKVGANDGLTGDPISALLLAEQAWTGLMIEPIPYVFEILKQNFSDARRFELLQSCVGAIQSKATFFFVDPHAKKKLELPNWYDRIGGLSREHLIKHLGDKVQDYVVELSLDVYPLSMILQERNRTTFELLHIDVEGHYFEVIKGLDWKKQLPLVIMAEQKHLSRDIRMEFYEKLERENYWTFPFGGELFAISKGAPQDLLAAAKFQ